MEVFVVGVAFADVAAEAVNGEVHLGEIDGVAGLLLAVDRQLFAGVVAVALHEMRRLHEHAARAARRVVDLAVERLEDLDNEPHYRGRREELAAFLALGESEIAEEILVDQAETVAFDRFGQRSQLSQQLDEHVAGHTGVVPR